MLETQRILERGEEARVHTGHVPIKDLRLLDVKLGQLPTWLASLNYTPRAFLESCKRERLCITFASSGCEQGEALHCSRKN
ncbi:ATP synthase subunit f, mitochondrial, partial [Ophiophagus hannah]